MTHHGNRYGWRWHGHKHSHHRNDHWLEFIIRRYKRRYGGDELKALEEYRRDIEQHLEDVSERIRRIEPRVTDAPARD